MNEKRENAVLIPYRKEGTEWQFYLQKRDMNAPRSPGVFGLFGGGLDEGETFEEAFVREIQEELNYSPRAPRYFSRYEAAQGIFHVFIEEVGNDFESKVKVDEGEYGKFLSAREVETMSDMWPAGRLIVIQLEEFLAQ